MRILIILIILIILCILLYLFYKAYKNEKKHITIPTWEYKGEPLFLNSWSDDFYGFPFQSVKITDNKILKICIISAPLYKDDRKKYYKLKNQGYLMLGICSYGFYPYLNEDDCKHDSRSATLKNDEMQEIIKDIKGWLICGKTKLPYNVPQLMFSESDCPNVDFIKPKGLSKKYDIIYNTGSDIEFHKHHKNWHLAKKCFSEMSKKGLKILIIGRKKSKNLDLPNIEYKPFIHWYEFLDKIEESKIMFVPNVSDASPRIITESLCKGVPIACNKNIFGGWKYINDNTGEFFTDEQDVINCIYKINNKNYDTRKWFLDNYFPNGESKARKELGQFILQLYHNK